MKYRNIVLMGIGEPLDNFDNVMKFLQTGQSPAGDEHRDAAHLAFHLRIDRNV